MANWEPLSTGNLFPLGASFHWEPLSTGSLSLCHARVCLPPLQIRSRSGRAALGPLPAWREGEEPPLSCQGVPFYFYIKTAPKSPPTAPPLPSLWPLENSPPCPSPAKCPECFSGTKAAGASCPPAHTCQPYSTTTPSLCRPTPCPTPACLFSWAQHGFVPLTGQ